MNQIERKPTEWSIGAKARLQGLDRSANPFTYPNPDPKDNEPWSFWNHGWSWADQMIRELGKFADKGIQAKVAV